MIALLNLTFILMRHNCLLLGLQKKIISWYYSFHLNKIFRLLFFWWTKAFLTQLDDTLPMFFVAFILYMSIMSYMYKLCAYLQRAYLQRVSWKLECNLSHD